MEETFIDCRTLEDLTYQVGEDLEVRKYDGDFCEEESDVHIVVGVVLEEEWMTCKEAAFRGGCGGGGHFCDLVIGGATRTATWDGVINIGYGGVLVRGQRAGGEY